MGKHIHTLSVNEKCSELRTFSYNFGRTKNIQIQIAKNYFSITAELTKLYDKEEMMSKDGYLFPDAVKKAKLLHLMLYSEDIEIKSMTVQIDDDSETVQFDSTDPYVYSLVSGKLIHDMGTAWTDDEINTILGQTKSKSDSRMASLYALLCSKSKRYELERFLYLWMSFNGMYGYFASLVSTAKGTKVRREDRQIRCFQKLFDWGNETISDPSEKHRVAKSVNAILKAREKSGAPTPTYVELLDGTSELAGKIDRLLTNPKTTKKYDLNSVGYFITQYAYYYRCNLFHANRPVTLFSFRDEGEVVCLRAINSVLEGFIQQELPNWFDSEYEKDILRKKAETLDPAK